MERKLNRFCRSSHSCGVCTCSSKRVISKFAHSFGFCVPIAVRGSVTSRHHVRQFTNSLRTFDIGMSPFTNVDCQPRERRDRSLALSLPLGRGARHRALKNYSGAWDEDPCRRNRYRPKLPDTQLFHRPTPLSCSRV